jgi:hypothetical protein
MLLVAPVLVGTVLSSCAGTREGVVVRDDVYYAPGQAPPVVDVAPPLSEATQQPAAAPDDYFNPGESAAAVPGSSGYYDVTYNDPYYYNYDRFGFDPTWNMNVGMGMGMGPWGGMSGWSLGFGTGWGTGGWGSPWGMPFWGSPWGWNGAWNMSPWNSPWGWDPWGWNNPWNAGWGMGWGYGPYFGHWGSCMTCYYPTMIGAGSCAYYGPRPGMGGGTARPVKSAGGLTPRDPVGLTRPSSTRPATTTQGQRPSSNGTLSRPLGGQPSGTRGSSTQERPSRNTQVRPGTNDRSTAPSRSGGYDRGGGSRPSSPSPGGGGVRPTTVPGRPR